MNTITIGIDLAKLAFSTCAVDAAGHVRQRKDFRRDAFAAWLPQLPAGTVVAIANKHARQLWAMLARGESYDADAWAKHPMAQRPKSTRTIAAS